LIHRIFLRRSNRPSYRPAARAPGVFVVIGGGETSLAFTENVTVSAEIGTKDHRFIIRGRRPRRA
jgi:hypothetical protein